jgi:hypothetical protein
LVVVLNPMMKIEFASRRPVPGQKEPLRGLRDFVV